MDSSATKPIKLSRQLSLDLEKSLRLAGKVYAEQGLSIKAQTYVDFEAQLKAMKFNSNGMTTNSTTTDAIHPEDLQFLETDDYPDIEFNQDLSETSSTEEDSDDDCIIMSETQPSKAPARKMSTPNNYTLVLGKDGKPLEPNMYYLI